MKRIYSRQRAFTIAEILVAMIFMAIVMPVAVQGVLIANRVGVVAEREKIAVQLADRILSTSIVTGDWEDGGDDGDFADEGWPEYRWELQSDTWGEDEVLYEVSVVVYYTVQGVEYSTWLTTLTYYPDDEVEEEEEVAE